MNAAEQGQEQPLPFTPRPVIAYTEIRPIVMDAAAVDLSVHVVDDLITTIRVSRDLALNLDAAGLRKLQAGIAEVLR